MSNPLLSCTRDSILPVLPTAKPQGWAVLCIILLFITGIPSAHAGDDDDRRLLLRGEGQQTSSADAAQQRYPSAQALRVALLYGEPTGTLSEGHPRVQEHVDPWLSFDKVQHLTFSALFTVGWQYGLERKLNWTRGEALPVSIGAAIAIGLGKEVYDGRLGPRRFFSYRDLVANGAGILLATGFILL